MPLIKKVFQRIWLVFFPRSFYHIIYFEISLMINRLIDEILKGKIKSKGIKLHLGAGTDILHGWINIDSSKRNGIDRVVDLRRELPFADESVKYIFSEHVFEHLDYYEELPHLLRECFRIMERGGIMRIVLPNAKKCVEYYIEGQKELFSFLPDKVNTPMEGLALVFTAHGYHKFGYDFETLALALKNAGFANVYETPYLGSSIELLNLENRNDERKVASLCVEAIKCEGSIYRLI